MAVNDRTLKIEKYQMVVARKIEQRVIWDEEGNSTYKHVPLAELLSMFLLKS